MKNIRDYRKAACIFVAASSSLFGCFSLFESAVSFDRTVIVLAELVLLSFADKSEIKKSVL